MKLVAKNLPRWFNINMKNLGFNIKDKLISKYLVEEKQLTERKSTDINVLLNRVKLNQKNDTRKKLYFSAAASTGLVLFGFLIF
tara:strand:- start:107 stop:358 length:252 start_codon:yes stop_codon:yes gene_type:complete